MVNQLMKPLTIVALLLTLSTWGNAQETRTGQRPQTWKVGDDTREALVFPPTKATEAPPIVFVFHGHGGNMNNSARLGFQKLWPEAVVVCPQGLPTATGRDPEGKRSGWQPRIGANDNRDVKFFDAMLSSLQEEHKLDVNRVYVTGHSNGGGFTYLLWAARGDKLAAIAPSAAGSANLQLAKNLKSIPVMHVAGEADAIVPFESQKRTMESVRKNNQCENEPKEWNKAGKLVGMLYPSKAAPFVSVIHPGTHKYPNEAPELIVKFFQEHQRTPE
jgi:polyhydroxybutyrate depolymerase